jgi:hypothetical protein
MKVVIFMVARYLSPLSCAFSTRNLGDHFPGVLGAFLKAYNDTRMYLPQAQNSDRLASVETEARIAGVQERVTQAEARATEAEAWAAQAVARAAEAEARAAELRGQLQAGQGPGLGLGAEGVSTASYAELEVATGGFDNVQIIGRGGFGPVYRGEWQGRAVAVKRLDAESLQVRSLDS